MKSTGTVLASSLTAEQQRNVLTPDQGGAGGDAVIPQMVAGGGKLLTPAEREMMTNRAANWEKQAKIEMEHGSFKTACSYFQRALNEMKIVAAQ